MKKSEFVKVPCADCGTLVLVKRTKRPAITMCGSCVVEYREGPKPYFENLEGAGK